VQNLFQQTLEPITGTLGPISPAQFMTLSGNACKLYIFCWNAEWVAIPLQQDRLPFGVGLQDIRTVLRAIHELCQHRCFDVRYDETALENPQDLRVQGKTVVLKTVSGIQAINRLFVRCVGFPEVMPEEVAQSLNGKLKRQIDYHQQRVQALQQEQAWWEQRIRRQSAPWDILIQ
jgi:hypothetical protein